VIRLPNWWAARRRSRPQVQVKIGTSAPAQVGLDSLLDFRPEVVVDGEVLTEAELKQLLKGTPGLQLLRGRWVEVDQERIREAVNHWKKVRASHPNGLEIVQGMRLLAGAAISGSETTAGEEAGWTRFEAGGWLRETLQRMRTPEAVDGVGGCQPGRDLQATLRPYQVRGVQWLWFMTELGLGACLADDMGLGKTIQILDLLLQRKRLAGERRCAPSLLIVPASLLGNWKQEAARFAPGLSVCLVHGSEMSAEELRRRTLDPEAGFADCDLVVISYGMVRRQAWLKQVRWSLIILDEAQAIKNSETAQTKAVKGLKSERRLVMTGTPIENHVGELWSLFDFCSPGLLGSVAEFRRYLKRLSEQGDGQAYAGLRRLVQPYILRRQKTDPEISRDLPEKIEMRAECGLTAQQAALYAGVVSDLKRQLKQVDGIQRRGLVLSSLLQFKQICNHPAQFLEEGEYLPEHSAKFERLRQLCEPIRARQEKVLVFTQFQSLCEPLSEFLRGVFGQPGLVLHGGTAVKRRSELVKEFQGDINRPFFVISLKAGGSGLNLTAASHVVHFDRWWNPAVENQATDRAFRIGQQRNVLVHKFVCRGTVEERIDEMIAGKRELAAQILDGDSGVKLTEMKDDELLKFVSLDLERATVV
jgi:SNF2 family DNA or RNA helicase